MKRLALIVAAALVGISLFLLTSASANSDLFAGGYPYLLALNGILVVALAGLVFVQLRTLWREYRARQFGSRIKYRLLLMFALMALLPGLLVYAVSLQFAVRSIESWFDVRVDSALEGGIALGQNALDYLMEQLDAKGRDMALLLSDRDAVSVPTLNRLREQAGMQSATVVNSTGTILATSSTELDRLMPALPNQTQLRQARQTQRYHAVESDADGGLRLRVILPSPSSRPSAEERSLQLLQPVPRTFARHAEAVQEAYREYQQLTLARVGRDIYTCFYQ
jgi:nitrogen fixation/metabolism regulation signal transduction histidine kinase